MLSVQITACFVAVGLFAVKGNFAQTREVNAVQKRVYRSLAPDLKSLLESMQNQLKYVVQNMATVEKLCHKSTAQAVAFSARFAKDATSFGNSIPFSVIVTNIGGAYNPRTGVFTAPTEGLYVFAWTAVAIPGKVFDSQLVVNGNYKLIQAANSARGRSHESTGCTGVLQLKKGDRVWIKPCCLTNYLRGGWSSFSGFKLM